MRPLQEHGYPCVHGVAYYRKWEEWSFQDIATRKVSKLYQYRSLQGLYTPNVMPTIMDGLKYDGKTWPPPLKRTTGRPKVARIRERSKFCDPMQSIIKCGKCGCPGHNVRTCERRKQNAEISATIRTRNQKKKQNEDELLVEVNNENKTPGTVDIEGQTVTKGIKRSKRDHE